MKCYLMNKNTKVALIEYSKETYSIEKIDQIYDIEFAPLPLMNASKDQSKSLIKELNLWFKGRGIPSWRKSITNLLKNLGVESTDELLNKSYALSLSDQYWIKDEKSEVNWKDINFFENDFKHKAYLEASLNDSSSSHPDLVSPNNTTDGMLQKAWIIENNKRILVKGTYTASKQEPTNEWLAAEICKRLGFEYCPYSLDIIDNKIVSKCESFISSNEEIISAYDIYCSEKKDNSRNDYQHYLSILQKNDVPNAQINLENMFIVDYLMMNTDRHMKNFGVIRNVETLKWERVTPIFDTGQAMNCDELTENMNFISGTGKFFKNTNKAFSDYLAEFTDLQRLDISTLKNIDVEYKNILKKYQENMALSDERIDKLAVGLKDRVSFLSHEIEKQAVLNKYPRGIAGMKKDAIKKVSESKSKNQSVPKKNLSR